VVVPTQQVWSEALPLLLHDLQVTKQELSPSGLCVVATNLTGVLEG
jgi:hypothetical protein